MTHENDALEASEADRMLGLIFGVVLDGEGNGRAIDFVTAKIWQPEKPGEVLWLHLDRTKPHVFEWLRKDLNISEATSEFLVSNETRPRAFREEDTLLATLRGLNFNPGDQPEDMIAMQFWAAEDRVLTLRRRRLHTPREIRARFVNGNGPKTAGDLITELMEELVAKMNHVIVELNERIDRLEGVADHDKIDDALSAISDIRRNCLALKRYMSPQHEALITIGRDAPRWLSEGNKRDIRETIARLQRYLDDLDVSKESALVIQDDLNSHVNNQASRTMYMLSIVAAVFLPLGFITGLLGINVGVMPGVNSAHAFGFTVVMLIVIFIGQLIVFRKLKWL